MTQTAAGVPPQQGSHNSRKASTATHEYWQKFRNKSLKWQKISLKVKKNA
jgi:hypothetical protein